MGTRFEIDSDLADQLTTIALDRGVSIDEVVNAAVRAGLQANCPDRFKMPTRDLGIRRDIDVDRAMHLADELEDDAIRSRLP